MSYNFIGEVENINTSQFEFISKVLNEQGYKGTDVNIQNVGKKGDNYGSRVKRIEVTFEDGKEFKMIIKIAPEDSIIRDQINANDLFKNEITIFNKLLPKLREIQVKYGVPDEDIFKYPICYGTNDELSNEIILLEDLKMRNFEMLDKTTPLSNQAVKLILKDLANFHSLSFVLRNKEPELLKNFMDTLVNAMINEKTIAQTQMFFEYTLNDLKTIFDNDRYKNVITDVTQYLIKGWMKLMNTDAGSKYSVIQHGDLWTNNIMFQMQEDQPMDCIFIDYQLSRDSLPVSDIHYLLFSCTDYQTRSKHYHEWMDYYHSELDRYLSYFDLKVNYVYPRDKFDADLKRYGKPGLGIAFVMVNIALRQTQEAPDLTNIDGTNLPDTLKVRSLMDKTVTSIKERIEGLIESCFELGYLTEPSKATFK
ncbi:hypothetical protein RR48_03866 [Papilio machaon]|uniref:CHK kinase-like domain-containing protein n=1 Tax=Papilio machaon TaxID=76193 RepID=A0A0N1IPP3_PAPMA|nr:hypothetical protein RR48_03866 [Papilio machaon]